MATHGVFLFTVESVAGVGSLHLNVSAGIGSVNLIFPILLIVFDYENHAHRRCTLLRCASVYLVVLGYGEKFAAKIAQRRRAVGQAVITGRMMFCCKCAVLPVTGKTAFIYLRRDGFVSAGLVTKATSSGKALRALRVVSWRPDPCCPVHVPPGTVRQRTSRVAATRVR
jgi:hypothetical protein